MLSRIWSLLLAVIAGGAFGILIWAGVVLDAGHSLPIGSCVLAGMGIGVIAFIINSLQYARRQYPV